jgi:hypothetical protein
MYSLAGGPTAPQAAISYYFQMLGMLPKLPVEIHEVPVKGNAAWTAEK